jgi:hypothetical protein
MNVKYASKFRELKAQFTNTFEILPTPKWLSHVHNKITRCQQLPHNVNIFDNKCAPFTKLHNLKFARRRYGRQSGNSFMKCQFTQLTTSNANIRSYSWQLTWQFHFHHEIITGPETDHQSLLSTDNICTIHTIIFISQRITLLHNLFQITKLTSIRVASDMSHTTEAVKPVYGVWPTGGLTKNCYV